MKDKSVNIVIAPHSEGLKDTYFHEGVISRLEELGNVDFEKDNEYYGIQKFKEKIKKADICITHWKTPKITPEILKEAGRLKMIAHAAGSVAHILSDEIYRKGIKVCGANTVMARYVAEATLAYMLAGLRLLVTHDSQMKSGAYRRCTDKVKSLINQKVGFIGLGTVGFHLLDMLRPFEVKIKIFDPYVDKNKLPGDMDIELCKDLNDVLSWAEVLTMHASRTPETYHMLNEKNMKLIRNGAVFINTARGANVDEKALIKELQSGRFFAVLDVYEKEPLPKDSPLLRIDNVILIPHMAGQPAKDRMTYAMADEIERFLNDESLIFEIPYEKYKLMTR